MKSRLISPVAASYRRYTQSTKGKARNRRYRASDKGKACMRRAKLKFHYNLAVEDYQRLFRKQRGRCPICGRKLPTCLRATVDHDHDTGRVRGLLHQKCNAALGMLEDKVSYARNAVEYLTHEIP